MNMVRAANSALDRVSRLDQTQRRWLFAAVIGIAVAVRVILMFATTVGGYDFQWYQWVGEAARNGNPYTAPIVPPTDVPAFQAATFAALGRPDGVPLRCLFLLGDVATLLLVAGMLQRSFPWRLNFACWIAFNPMLIFVWVATVEDKNLYILCVVAAIVGVESGRLALAWVSAALFATFKFVGGFLVPPIALVTARSRGRRAALIALVAFGVAFAASHIPWFPDNLDAYSRRDARTAATAPFHSSWTILLHSVHLYDPILVKVVIVGGLAAAYGLFAMGRISATESMVLALISAFIVLPDTSADRIMLLTVLFILITPLTRGGWALMWATSLVAGIAVEVSGRIVSIPILGPQLTKLEHVVGSAGQIRNVVLLNLPLFAAAGLYVASHLRGGVASPRARGSRVAGAV